MILLHRPSRRGEISHFGWSRLQRQSRDWLISQNTESSRTTNAFWKSKNSSTLSWWRNMKTGRKLVTRRKKISRQKRKDGKRHLKKSFLLSKNWKEMPVPVDKKAEKNIEGREAEVSIPQGEQNTSVAQMRGFRRKGGDRGATISWLTKRRKRKGGPRRRRSRGRRIKVWLTKRRRARRRSFVGLWGKEVEARNGVNSVKNEKKGKTKLKSGGNWKLSRLRRLKLLACTIVWLVRAITIVLKAIIAFCAQVKRQKFAWTWLSHNILQMTSKNEETLYLVVDPPKVGEAYPEDGPNSRYGLECWQLGNLVCGFSALTRSSVISADGGPLNSYRPFFLGSDLIIRPMISTLNIAKQSILIVALWLSSAYAEWREGPEDNSYLKGIEVKPRETVRKSYPEDVYNPTVVPQYYEVRQSGRILQLRNKDLWIWLTDLSWHFLILVTVRELPFKDYRGRSLANLKARNEAMKQKDPENKKVKSNRDTTW